jgi:hypothetical protein
MFGREDLGYSSTVGDGTCLFYSVKQYQVMLKSPDTVYSTTQVSNLASADDGVKYRKIASDTLRYHKPGFLRMVCDSNRVNKLPLPDEEKFKKYLEGTEGKNDSLCPCLQPTYRI